MDRRISRKGLKQLRHLHDSKHKASADLFKPCIIALRPHRSDSCEFVYWFKTLFDVYACIVSQMNKQLDRVVPDRCVELSRRTVPCFYWMNSCRTNSCQNEWVFRVSHAADGFLYVCQ